MLFTCNTEIYTAEWMKLAATGPSWEADGNTKTRQNLLIWPGFLLHPFQDV